MGAELGGVFVDKPESVPSIGLWFWSHGDTLYSSHVTSLTLLWCDVHRWATDKGCRSCARGDFETEPITELEASNVDHN